MTNLKSLALGIVIGLLIAAGYVAWKAGQTPKAVPGEVTPEIRGQVATPEVRTVYVYRNAKKPKGTTGDVLTAVKTDTGTATTLLDTEGRASIVLQTDPLPWLARESHHEVTLIYGQMDGETVTRGGYRWSFLRSKRFHAVAAIEANLGASGESLTLVGVGLSYRW